MKVANCKNIHFTRWGEKPECPERFRTIIKGYYERVIPKKEPVKCPDCNIDMNENDHPYKNFIDCPECGKDGEKGRRTG